jgi:hypothetical protein
LEIRGEDHLVVLADLGAPAGIDVGIPAAMGRKVRAAMGKVVLLVRDWIRWTD